MLVRSASSFALATALALGAPSIAVAEIAHTPVAASVESTRAPTEASRTESKDYARREAKHRAIADYRGGNTVVIAMSGGTVVVLLILLLLL